jgi:predicted tellurium resistance membrane protein TerC
MKQLLLAIGAVALTDLSLQLDNALAISSVAAQVPPSQRVAVLAGGVALAALCLLAFTITGSFLVARLSWLKPVAGLVLVAIGIQLVLAYLHERGQLPW